MGRIPAKLHDELVNLEVVFDAEHPDGSITGAYPFYNEGETETQAEEQLVDNNIKVLAHYDIGFRCVTTSESVGPVNSVEDMQGLVIRTPENQIVMQTMQLLGAEPKVLGFDKVYEALKNGEFDAQENPIPVIYNNNLFEVQKNLAITNHSYDVMLFVIRDDIWEDLSE